MNETEIKLRMNMKGTLNGKYELQRNYQIQILGIQTNEENNIQQEM